MDIDIEIPDRPPMALDRRTYDVDGMLTITESVISAAQVNPYLGREIPEADALGLDPDRVYNLYRDPAALKEAVPLFNGKPLLIEHAPVSAADPKQQLIVGTVSDCRWSDGKVIGTVNVWDADAIRGIESSALRDLSAGYRYTCNMTPGVTRSGEHYDGRMLSIAPNHVALVIEGRVEGAQVGDSAVDRVRRPVTVLEWIAADRDRTRLARERNPLACAIPGYFRLP